MLHFGVKRVRKVPSFPKQVTIKSEVSTLTILVRSMTRNRQFSCFSWNFMKFRVFSEKGMITAGFETPWNSWKFRKIHDRVMKIEDFSTGRAVVVVTVQYPEVPTTHYPGYVPPPQWRLSQPGYAVSTCLSSHGLFARLLLVTTVRHVPLFILSGSVINPISCFWRFLLRK